MVLVCVFSSRSRFPYEVTNAEKGTLIVRPPRTVHILQLANDTCRKARVIGIEELRRKYGIDAS